MAVFKAYNDYRVYLGIDANNLLNIPVGTSAARPTGLDLSTGTIRFNTTLGSFEWYDGTTWVQAASGSASVAAKDEGSTIIAGVSSFNFIGPFVTVTDAGSGQANVTITSSVITTLMFKIGDPGKPADGSSTYTDAALINKTVRLYREGERQFLGDTIYGYTFNAPTGLITFFPSLTATERIVIDYQ